MASILIFSFLFKTKFRRKSIMILNVILFVYVMTAMANNSLIPVFSKNNCENILCHHGICQNGTCNCDKGWQGAACHRCDGRVRLTETSGFITDGVDNYPTDLQCTWLIDSDKTNSLIRLKFMEFETECSWDHLYIFDGDSVFSPLIAAFSGLLIRKGQIYHKIPELIARTGQAYLYFYSDVALNMTGFNISYSVDSCISNCPNNNRSICNGDYCLCVGAWEGPNCELICPNNCSSHGICDFESKRCVCENGFIGEDCGQSEKDGYWQIIEPTGEISPRALHQSVLLNDSFWVIGGEGFNKDVETDQMVARYDLNLKKWIILKDTDKKVEPRFGHSLAVYNKKIYMFGGMSQNRLVTNELWIFDGNKWELHSNDNIRIRKCPNEFCSPLKVMGHTATVVGDKMIVIFGYSLAFGYLNTVQEYDFRKRTWSLVKTNGAIVDGGFGHTSVYYHKQDLIYVHGGYHGFGNVAILDKMLYAYNHKKRSWRLLYPSQHPRYLHSAVIINGLMYIYGGSGHDSNFGDANDECFSAQFLAYDLERNEWLTMKETEASGGRYGHSAIAYRDFMYVFGGFNGLMHNSTIKYVPGNCSSSNECFKNKLTFSSERSSNHSELCSEQNSCSSCLGNLYNCVWCKDSCAYEKCHDSDSKKISDVNRCNAADVKASECEKMHNCHSCHTLEHCAWQPTENGIKCRSFLRDTGNRTLSSDESSRKPICDAPCYLRTSCSNCTQGGCMWCSSLRKCVDSNAYAVAFPIGQCMEWTTHYEKCSNLVCSQIDSCEKCQKNPRCGWCDNGLGTGVGNCMEGGNNSPRSPKHCPKGRWFFTGCPKCQCNGHSSCRNSSICDECQHLTIGDHCESCKKGYFGNPINGGNCTACFCNNHSSHCDAHTGKCHCTTKGIIGDHCERCDESSHYYGSPSEEGGSCFYNLTIDFQYTFNMSKKEDIYLEQINFMNTPVKSEIDVDFTISCTGNAFFNISIGSPPTIIKEKMICGSTKLRFGHEENSFGSENATFYVNVYGFETPFLLMISFSQHRTIDLLQFFVTFSTCFLTLLIIAGVVWKIKQRFDIYRRRQQMYIELEHMASRPFANIVVELNREAEAESFLVKNNPTPIALEPCNTGKAAVLSLLLRLPFGGPLTLPGKTGIAVGSALVSLGTLDTNFTKEEENKKSAEEQNSVIRLKPQCSLYF